MSGQANFASTSDAIVAPISFVASGDNTIVAGIANQTIRILQIAFVVTGATNVTIKNGASIAFSGALPLAANGSVVLDYGPAPHFITDKGNNFVINSSAGTQISGWVAYTQGITA